MSKLVFGMHLVDIVYKNTHNRSMIKLILDFTLNNIIFI